MRYKLNDRQGSGARKDVIYNSKKEVREDLLSFHSPDLDIENPEQLTLDDLLEIGDWELIEINKHDPRTCENSVPCSDCESA